MILNFNNSFFILAFVFFIPNYLNLLSSKQLESPITPYNQRSAVNNIEMFRNVDTQTYFHLNRSPSPD
jgi:hypothetical protein